MESGDRPASASCSLSCAGLLDPSSPPIENTAFERWCQAVTNAQLLGSC